MSPTKPNLIYTVALDPPGSEGCRMLAKMLASSLLRTFFTGDLLVFRNSPAPLFLVERKGLEEIFIEIPDIHGIEGAEFSPKGVTPLPYDADSAPHPFVAGHGNLSLFSLFPDPKPSRRKRGRETESALSRGKHGHGTGAHESAIPSPYATFDEILKNRERPQRFSF